MAEKNIIEFFKCRDVKTPSRANPTDAGVDFFVPIFDQKFIEDFHTKNPILYSKDLPGPFHHDTIEGKDYIDVHPGERVNIPSGIHCKMNGGNRALIAFNKSGISTKFGLVVGAQVVDESYEGEIHINVINTSNSTVSIYEGQKLVQFIELPIYISDWVEKESKESLYPIKSNRGEGGFSSTGLF